MALLHLDFRETKKAGAGLVASIVTSAVAFAVTYFGLNLSPELSAGLATAITGVVVNKTVYRVPNEVDV